MHLQVSDQGVTVVIVAERSETLDLMRRHGDLLTRDIGRLGHDNVSLSFGDPGNPGHAPRGGQGGPSNIQEAADPEGEDRPAYSTTSGMDLRL
ncbi:hypothetical protein GCM10011360_38440 [Primorskyibacter flagellatus]|uniref:Flagellar hook-length control protein FliK n=2 Tax=Primorskyibacter flagellatus TaxID=1387277 RepID=A0A917EIP4_9RHOB|nr:hypothetical protein GCM10011360_38440 [Primorskyibacter flagellatus]